MTSESQGPLLGVRVVELAAQGPAPFCGMMLSDMGADVVRIDRPNAAMQRELGILERGRRSVMLDLKSPSERQAALGLIAKADILIEGYRPGVMERLGLGPDVALGINPTLVYGRMTGWGQSGPIAPKGGHDLNYVAMSGALHMIGPKERPMSPLNLVGDYGGGGTFLTMGVLAALVHARRTGQGQVVDASMIDGISTLMAANYGSLASGRLVEEREANGLNGSSPWGNVYRCSDGHFIAFQAYEPQFYREMLSGLGLGDDPLFEPQHDAAVWPEQRARIAAVVETRSRAEWTEHFADSDACFSPVLTMSEAQRHPHMRARDAFQLSDDMLQPAPAPRFSATPGAIAGPQRPAGADQQEVFRSWNVAEPKEAVR
ncbi:MAG: CaiB/BaiF CoA-transferase family protein [Sphingobium sp.]